MIDRLRCSKCGSTEKLFKKNKNRTKTIQYYWCRDCNAKYMRDYYNTPRGKEVRIKNNKDYEERNHERTLAWRTAQNHIKDQKPCIICGKLPTQMHHPDILQRLNVVFLCAYHHKQADKHSKITKE